MVGLIVTPGGAQTFEFTFMRLKLFKTLWGHTTSFEDAARQAIDAGFDGIEGPSPESKTDRQVHRKILSDHGLDQGPQVPDPRAPEFAPALRAHEIWWSRLLRGMRQRKISCATMTPEFGPDGYLHLEPFTQHPVADLWELNKWIGQRQKARFKELHE
jgi:sugar phosphate isomerase/epimerase